MAKILLVLPYWVKGGAEKQFRYICEELTLQNNVDIFFLNKNNENIEGINKEIYIKNAIFDENNNKISKYFRRFFDYIKIYYNILFKLEKYDIVIGHNKLILPLMLAFKFKSKKVVFSPREADPKFASGILKFILSKIDCIIVNSIATKKLIKDVNHKIYMINNGVEIKEKKYFEDTNDLKNIGVIANISRRKNIHVAIQAINTKQNQDKRLFIAGKVFDSEYYKELLTYIKENKLEDRVNLLGYVEDIDEFYESIDLMILPSLYEGTSNVILESYARCKCILLSDIEENKPLCINNKNIFSTNDYLCLSERIYKIQQLLKYNIDDYNKIIENQYNLVLNEYSIDSLKKEYRKLINLLVS